MRSVPADHARPGSRIPGVVVACVGASATVLLAWWLVPWEFWRGAEVDPGMAARLFTPAEIQHAEEYSSAARAWSWSGLAASFVTLGLLATPPLRRRLARVARQHSWWVRAALVTVLVLAVVRIVTLPFAWGGFELRRDHGLTTQGSMDFLADLLHGLAVDAVPVVLLVLVVMGSARRAGRWWPVAVGVVLAGAVVLGSFVHPVVVEPLSHDFVPLAESDLRRDVERLAAREGVTIDEVVIADASRRTTRLNAWISGLGPTRRVVLYDTLVEEVPREQVLAVVAHEPAHARHHDVVIGTALGAGGAVGGVGLLAVLLPWRSRPESGEGGPSTDLTSVSVVPVLVLLLALGLQLASPVQNGVSRALERRADHVALEMTSDPDAFVEVQMALARRSLADPTPPRLSRWWWSSHPGVLERVAVAEATR